MKMKIAIMFLAILILSSNSMLLVSAPARRTECFGKGVYRIIEFAYTEQTDWETLTGGVAEINIKVTDKLHPKLGYGRLEWIIDDLSEQDKKILASVNINEPLFYPFIPTFPLRADFSGEADFIWENSKGTTTFEVIIEDGDPVGVPDRFRIEVGGGEPVLIGEISSNTISGTVFIPSYDTIVFRGNVVVIGGATSYEVGGTSFTVSSGECIVATATSLVVAGPDVDGGSIVAGPTVFHMDGKGNDCSLSSLDGKGNDLRINGMEPIIINGGDTIVADGGYTVIRGANDSFDPTLGVDLFIRSKIIIKI